LARENLSKLMNHYNITITGKVHRVGFRFSAMEAAYRYSILGNVKNGGANTVIIEAEGTSENLALFLDWCRKGPLGARVDKLDFQESPVKNFTMFEILNGT